MENDAEGHPTKLMDNKNDYWSGLAVHPSSGDIVLSNGKELHIVNPSDGSYQVLAKVAFSGFNHLAFSPSGTLFVCDCTGKRIYEISSATFTREPEPILCTDPDPLSHDFCTVPEGQTRDWTFDITNCGSGTLTGTVSTDKKWITVTPTSGSTTTETDTATVSIDTSSLECGKTHTGTITGSSDAGGTKEGMITVYVPASAVTIIPTRPPNNARDVVIRPRFHWEVEPYEFHSININSF